MLNLFQHLTGLMFSFPIGKIPKRVRDDIKNQPVMLTKSVLQSELKFTVTLKLFQGLKNLG